MDWGIDTTVKTPLLFVFIARIVFSWINSLFYFLIIIIYLFLLLFFCMALYNGKGVEKEEKISG